MMNQTHECKEKKLAKIIKKKKSTTTKYKQTNKKILRAVLKVKFNKIVNKIYLCFVYLGLLLISSFNGMKTM